MRRLLFILPVLIIGLAISGCGVNKHQAYVNNPQKTQVTVVAKSTAPVTSQSAPGVVKVAGIDANSFTAHAVQDYYTNGGSSKVELQSTSATDGFEQLCRGETDVVNSITTISEATLHLCNENHVQLVQFHVASDAVVVAMKNETDVGADCLTMHQVYDTFRSGSPIYNWQQLGFDDVPLKITGPSPGNPVFDLFAQLVFNVEQPGLIDFSSGYVPQPNSDAVRLYVTGHEGESATAGFLAVRRTNLANIDKELAGATATLEGAEEAVNSTLYQIHKGERDHWTESLENHYRGLLKYYERKKSAATSRVKILRAQHAVALALLTQSERATQAEAGQIGRLGIFRFSYYQLYEEQLRPLEITLDGKEDCIFPSQATISNGTYPLGERIFLTTTLKGLQRQETRGFISEYLENVQSLSATEEVVPVPESELREERAWLGGTAAPRVLNPGA